MLLEEPVLPLFRDSAKVVVDQAARSMYKIRSMEAMTQKGAQCSAEGRLNSVVVSRQMR